ncbi:D-alanyl-D-alanine carboxypeptidase / D-alanyl-D-alanine-endopeptidase (penicillin-binding protein 4) [Nannocystis exedens]|uniref:D-alanyl-D-alanine carboxypeptidase / D-alanyl-D-alanine-endopeptidase (Penicillin-binding protein 4) n=1 Tax=Nannocystis exedens TaxID=54 RepID=A0A1I1TL22_9BACT|nr:D-alanyl-D-alanine carboxypeptidase/D-alanyl-D-alanine-endopeptidase [Nannocystis exedens]PCC66492.1 D-alanyl-D-alanine carboxypeptidase [Nannocystis exedens]SFD59227.1 D-alanyl-D-alanine carboxypeptidase / D-alanyl-D-alanine-endopeptidase (penicillin-binding protein 4) [Nannocystis exedens]
MHVWPAAAGAITLVAAAVLAFEGGALTRLVAPVPYAMSLEAGESEPRRDAYVEVVVVPDELPPPTAEERLMTRLAAVSRAVELARGDARPRIALDTAGLDAAIRKIVAPLERLASVSVHVRDLGSDTVLFDFQGDVPLNPASNNKLLTTAAALDLLGADYRFETRVLRHGEDLVLVGEGDPSFDHVALAALADEIAARTDLASLTRIVVDDAAFSQRRLAPGFSDTEIGLSYQAPSGALSLDFNTVAITVAPGPEGPVVTLVPDSTHVVIDNRATIGSGAPTVRTYARGEGDAVETVVEVTGKIRRRAKPVQVRRRISDPGLYTGGALAVMLAARGQDAPLPVVRGRAPTYGNGAEPVARRDSAPLAVIAADALAFSNNFMAEQLLRTLGWRVTQSPGDWDNGAQVVLGYWRALGLDPNALVFENGSGLSDLGRVTTSALVDLIAVAGRVRAAEGGLVSALPVAGERGTMLSRLRKSGKRVRAKTGTLDGVSGLTGVITAEDGTPQVGFSILINVDDGRVAVAAKRKRAEDRIVMAVLRHLDAWAAAGGAGGDAASKPAPGGSAKKTADERVASGEPPGGPASDAPADPPAG